MRDLIERAIAIIEVERDVLFKCHQVRGVVKIEDEADQVAVDAMNAMDRWLADARAALCLPDQPGAARAGVVTLKPIDWRNGCASTPIGDYLVVEEDWDDEPFWFIIFNGKTLNKLGEHKDEAAAVAAAQADYERRILSALVTEPSPAQADERVVEALDEGLEILVNLTDSIAKHGNYSPESTCVFIDQAGQCFRAAKAALSAQPQPAQDAPIVERTPLRDSVAAVLFQAGTPDQQIEALAYIHGKLPAAPQPAHADGWRPTHRHVKTGGEYMLLGIGRMQTGSWNAHGTSPEGGYIVSVDMHEVAIYRGPGDNLWVRPREEFEDGRFEALPAAPTPAPAEGR